MGKECRNRVFPRVMELKLGRRTVKKDRQMGRRVKRMNWKSLGRPENLPGGSSSYSELEGKERVVGRRTACISDSRAGRITAFYGSGCGSR